MSLLARFEALLAAWQRGDLDAAVARLAPEVVWHYAAGARPPARGRAAARVVLDSYSRMQTENRLRLVAHAETADTLFLEAIEDFDTPGGQRVQVPYAGVIVFDGGGLIAGWRDYYDHALMEAQIATGTAALPRFCADLTDRLSD